MKLVVTFLCVETSHDWGTAGHRVRMVFNLPTTMKHINDTKPGGWVVESFEEDKETT